MIQALIDLLGPDAVRTSCEPWTDISGDALGTPFCVVSPQGSEQVAAMVSMARSHGRSLVPIGARTAYWTPLRVEGAVALDIQNLRGCELRDDVVTVGAGEPVRPLDTFLRSQGFALPVHPDAFGETSVGAMVASGLTSGIGMARGGIDRWVTGLTVVTGTGEILKTGTSQGFEKTGPFLREGLPDPTGLFMGSEGTLGIISEVSLRVRPLPWIVSVQGRHLDPKVLLDSGRALCRLGLCDTFRAVREVEPGDGSSDLNVGWNLYVSVDSLLSLEEARSRAERVAAMLERAGVQGLALQEESTDARMGLEAASNPRWQGPIGFHAQFRKRDHLVGLDVNASYEAMPALLEIADGQAREAMALSPTMVRTALYLAPGFVNLGMHTSVPRRIPMEDLVAHRSRWLTALASHPVVPYRPGFAWPPEMLEKVLPGRRALLHQLKDVFDPDGILHPTHPLVAS